MIRILYWRSLHKIIPTVHILNTLKKGECQDNDMSWISFLHSCGLWLSFWNSGVLCLVYIYAIYTPMYSTYSRSHAYIRVHHGQTSWTLIACFHPWHHSSLLAPYMSRWNIHTVEYMEIQKSPWFKQGDFWICVFQYTEIPKSPCI